MLAGKLDEVKLNYYTEWKRDNGWISPHSHMLSDEYHIEWLIDEHTVVRINREVRDTSWWVNRREINWW